MTQLDDAIGLQCGHRLLPHPSGGQRPPSAAPLTPGSFLLPSAPRQPAGATAARYSAMQRDFGWRWTGVSGWGRVAPQGGPRVQPDGGRMQIEGLTYLLTLDVRV
jgi:hypothetical protein